MHAVTQASGRTNPIWKPQRKLSRLSGLKRSTLEENKIQKLRVESFQPLRRVICQILKRQTRARNQLTNSSARMFQCVRRPSPKKISRGKRIRCSLCCAKKSANPRVPAAIFSKSGAVPSHSSQNGVSTPFLNIRRPISSGGAAIGSNSASVRDRFNVIPSEVEGSQYVTLKVPQRDSSTSLGMTKRDSRLQNASSGSFTLRARSSNRVNSFKKVRGISPTGPLRCLAMISSASPSFSARASSSSS